MSPGRLALWIHAPFAWAMFALGMILGGLFGTAGQLLALPFDRERRVVMVTNRWFWGYLAFAMSPTLAMRRSGVRRSGAGPYVVVCNHSSILDVPACMSLPTPLRVVAVRKNFEVPLLGWFLRLTKQIPIDPGDPEASLVCLEQCRRSLEAGISVLMFPEGTRSDGERIGRFRSGAFRLSIETGVPVLPVVVYGHHKVLPKGVLLPQSFHQALRLAALEPVRPEPGQTPRQLARAVRARMEPAWEKIRAEVR